MPLMLAQLFPTFMKKSTVFVFHDFGILIVLAVDEAVKVGVTAGAAREVWLTSYLDPLFDSRRASVRRPSRIFTTSSISARACRWVDPQ